MAGKFLERAGEKLYVKGVTYGTFADGGYPERWQVERDLTGMAEAGLNAVRTYTPPPRWLLDSAAQLGIGVMVGLPWEQHVAFLDSRRTARSIEDRVRAMTLECADHPAVLALAIGNEIPASIVRWHGPRPVERFLERLHRAVKSEDPEALVTYVNFPSTEYLDLPFLDFAAFNVYLEQRERFEAYLARLHNLSPELPLVMAEMGLDSRRNGHDAQARALDWQIDAAFGAGCAGTFVFAWTDEWHRGGFEIDDWDFGLVDRGRRPKPALDAVRSAYERGPRGTRQQWPKVSVVVCSYNGARTLEDTCQGLQKLRYPDFEVIVVSDGSTDATAEIARRHGFTVIETDNRGLSRARNTGAAAATGEIVAYLDDDARPDPDWLTYLALTFMETDHAAVGGPNLPPDEDGPIAYCVAASPGGPAHVLLDDTEAEHLPGCNLAIRRDRLEAIGGFDPQFRAAGDDVDVCWRLQEAGDTLGFHPAAIVWHHRRDSLKGYWRQQVGYGKAEALLEVKYPHRYNRFGHPAWGGQMYGPGTPPSLLPKRPRVFYGTWGTALFQSVYGQPVGLLRHLPLMPEWYLTLMALWSFVVAGLVWSPLLAVAPLAVLATVLAVVHAGAAAKDAMSAPPARGGRHRLGLWGLTALMWAIQPAARLRGRLRGGLTPWRRRGTRSPAWPRQRRWTDWTEVWQAPEERLAQVERDLQARGLPVRRGGDYDAWDLEVRGGLFGGARLHLAVEEHGAGRQLFRFRAHPRLWRPAAALAAATAVLGAAMFASGAAEFAAGLFAAAGGVLLRSLLDGGAAVAALHPSATRSRQPEVAWLNPASAEAGER